MIGYLRLVRLPNAATAIADIIMGYSIAGLSESGNYSAWALLAGASASLYLAGMAFNDLADRQEDAVVRPNRPIPSGQVTLASAGICAGGLMLLGIGLAYCVHQQSMICALVLSVAILHYDFGAKGRFIMGPAILGLCRFFNVELGMTPATEIGKSFLSNPWMPAVAVGIYGAGLTAFSVQEEEGRQMRAIVTGALLCAAGIGFAAAFSTQLLALAALAPLALILVWRVARLKREGTPAAARNLVRSGVMGICLLDAGMILGRLGPAGVPAALICVALLIPSTIVAKLIAQKEA